MSSAILWAAITILFLVGMVGIFIPLLPGIALVFAGIAIYSIATDFTVIGPLALGVFALVTGLAWLADYFGSAIGARAGGGKLPSVLGAIAGAIAGTLMIGPLGLFLGAFLGAVLGALYEGQTNQQAMKTAALSMVGIVGGTIVQFIVAAGMIITFLIMVITR